MVRRTQTEPKTALAGVILENSFARFVASMATFSEERILPCSFGRRDLVFMVKSKGSHEKTTWGGTMRTWYGWVVVSLLPRASCRHSHLKRSELVAGALMIDDARKDRI